MENLKERLERFYASEALNSEDKLQELFEGIASHILYGGYIQVSKKKIFVFDVEFYYHQENGEIKDPIMYRTNERLAKEGKNGSYSYLPIGTLNVHVSGIDIMFDNEQMNTRAGILLRGIEMEEEVETNIDFQKREINGRRYETRPTYFYGEILCSASIFDTDFSIKWIDTDINGVPEIESFPRLRVGNCNRKWRFVRKDRVNIMKKK
jgi:hypothetical protein